MKDFVAIDFETANRALSSVCSMGIVTVRDGMIAETFYSLIRPLPNYYEYWNTRIHGMTQKDTESALTFPEVWEKVATGIQGLPLVAHNSLFDEGCLKAVFRAYSMPYPAYQFHCTYRAARKKWKHLVNHRLHTVAAYCGFDLNNHHHALADAEACAAIARKLFADPSDWGTDKGEKDA